MHQGTFYLAGGRVACPPEGKFSSLVTKPTNQARRSGICEVNEGKAKTPWVGSDIAVCEETQTHPAPRL